MWVNIEINATKEPLQCLLRKIMLLYSVDAIRFRYTFLKKLEMAEEGAERFAENAMRGVAFTDGEKDQVMETFLTTLQMQARESREAQHD